MFRRFVCLSVGALALVVVLGAPGPLHAQHMRGGFSHGMHPGFHGVMPGFRGGFDPRLNHGFFNPGFGRSFMDPRFNRGRFDRFEDMFENRFNRGFFDPRFNLGFRPSFLGRF